MKKLALIITVAGMIGLTSCAKDTVCEQTIGGAKYVVTLSANEAEVCIDDVCETTKYEDSSDVADKAEAKAQLEDQGFTCK